MVFVSGQIGWDESGRFPASDIAAQVCQALRNVVAVLAEAGARPEHVTRLTWYVTDKREYLAAQPEIGAAYREVMGAHYPAMSVVEVTALLEDAAKVRNRSDRRHVPRPDAVTCAERVGPRRSGNDEAMTDDRSTDRTETDERVAENRAPSPRRTVGNPADADPATGLPKGTHDDDHSPLDPGGTLDPFGGPDPPFDPSASSGG